MQIPRSQNAKMGFSDGGHNANSYTVLLCYELHLLKYKVVELVLLRRQYIANVSKAIYVKVFKLPDDLETA